jgi:hypothetical protein
MPVETIEAMILVDAGTSAKPVTVTRLAPLCPPGSVRGVPSNGRSYRDGGEDAD